MLLGNNGYPPKPGSLLVPNPDFLGTQSPGFGVQKARTG